MIFVLFCDKYMTNELCYDNIIVGGGPTGITMAYLLQSHGRTLLIEAEESLGGCHRVIRVDGHFTEHCPRVYLGNYLNWQALLKSMGLNHDDYFQRYKFSAGSGISLILQTLSLSEMLHLVGAFGQLMINSSFGKDIAVGTYAKKYSEKARFVLDRMCRLTDGSNIDSCNLWGFLNLFNMNVFYSIYQPRVALDHKLWPDIQNKLSLCDILLGTKVTNLYKGNNRYYVETEKDARRFETKRVFLAVPPMALSNILPQYRTFAEETAYLSYIQMTLSWKWKSPALTTWGSVVGPWGLIWIPLSDYLTSESLNEYQTVISVAISKQDIVGLNGYRACDATPEQLVQEVLDQLHLPSPDSSLLNPKLYHDGKQWVSSDVAYVKKPRKPILPAKIDDNLYTIGWHNDNGTLAFTTLENAVVSAQVLANELPTGQATKTIIKEPITLRYIIIILLLLIVLSIFATLRFTLLNNIFTFRIEKIKL